MQYLLTGTVRWDKSKDGAGRIKVSPELIAVATGASKWQESFDASISDVFQVQADVAGRVAQALNVALTEPAKHQSGGEAHREPRRLRRVSPGPELRAAGPAQRRATAHDDRAGYVPAGYRGRLGIRAGVGGSRQCEPLYPAARPLRPGEPGAGPPGRGTGRGASARRPRRRIWRSGTSSTKWNTTWRARRPSTTPRSGCNPATPKSSTRSRTISGAAGAGTRRSRRCSGRSRSIPVRPSGSWGSPGRTLRGSATPRRTARMAGRSRSRPISTTPTSRRAAR